MPIVRQGALPPIPAIKFGAAIDINEVRLGTIAVWQKSILRDDFSDATVTGLGPNWADHGPAVDPCRAMVDPGGYARINIPDTGLVAPGVAMQTSRWRYSAVVTPIDDSYLEVKLGPMGSWRGNYLSRAYLRGSNTAFTDGVGFAVASSGQLQFSILIGSTETLVSIPNATAQTGDVLRLTPSNRTFVLTKNGRYMGTWTDPGTTTQKGGGFRSVLASFMGSKDGPVGVRQFSPAFDYIEAGGGVNGITTPAIGSNGRQSVRNISVRPGNSYVPQAGDMLLVFSSNSEPGRTISMPGDGSWTNLLGAGNTTITTTAHCAAAIWHLVTLAEEQAGTNSWTLPGFWTANSFGRTWVVVLRGVDPAAPINAFATGSNNASNATPHVIPGLPSAGLKDRSIVIGHVIADQAVQYPDSGTPAGWTKTAAVSDNFTGAQAVYQRDALTQVGVPVLSANVVPSVGDEYIGIIVAVAVKPNT